MGLMETLHISNMRTISLEFAWSRRDFQVPGSADSRLLHSDWLTQIDPNPERLMYSLRVPLTSLSPPLQALN